ncbi:hypothetical protein Tco_1559482, partial [Tanacetum coccineum]
IPRGLKPKEETFQVVLDALALTPSYPAFLITADVPKVYMHQFWNCIYKHDDFYRFKIDKKKRFKLTLEVFCWELNTTELVLPSQQLVLLEENRLKTVGYKVTTAGSRLLLLVKKLMLLVQVNTVRHNLMLVD